MKQVEEWLEYRAVEHPGPRKTTVFYPSLNGPPVDESVIRPHCGVTRHASLMQSWHSELKRHPPTLITKAERSRITSPEGPTSVDRGMSEVADLVELLQRSVQGATAWKLETH